MSKKNKYKIQIGDVLYEASKMYRKVIKWEIKDIFFEFYVGGTKTITYAYNDEFMGYKEFYPSDILAMFDTKEEAEENLKEKMD